MAIQGLEQQLAGAMRRQLLSDASKVTWRPLPHQQPPPGDWRGWLLLGGRFTGKTDAGSHYMVQHVHGPPCTRGRHPHRMAIIAPTKGDASYSCYTGPSGIQAHDASAEKVTTTDGTIIRWPNGSYAKLFGAESEKDVDRLRAGGNNCLVWAEELAAWTWLDLAWKHMQLGLRSGRTPRWIATTTPRPRKLIKDLYRGEPWSRVMTHGTSHDNPHVPDEVKAEILGPLQGTDLAEQEIEGKLIDQLATALWKREQLAKYRLSLEQAPLLIMRRRIVGVDPSGGAGEQGIVVIGFSDTPIEAHPEHHDAVPRGFVLADYSTTLAPDGWGDRAVQAAIDWDADAIVAESDYGRDMPISVLVNAADRAGITVPIKGARAGAIGNKRARAFPVAAKAAQGRYPHVGFHEQLEDQLCTWDETMNYSPDRLDAAVWPAWAAGLVTTTYTGAGALPGVVTVDEVTGQQITAAGTSVSPFGRRGV